MAYQRNNAQRNNTESNGANDSWKASGFINLYLPSKNGGRRKLGAIKLMDSKVNERDLRAWLEADEGNIQILINRMEVEYQSATPAEGTGFDLSAPAPATGTTGD